MIWERLVWYVFWRGLLFGGIEGIVFGTLAYPFAGAVYGVVIGTVVGAANIMLAKSVVGRRLSILADRMRHVESNLAAMTKDGNMDRCKQARVSLLRGTAQRIRRCHVQYHA